MRKTSRIMLITVGLAMIAGITSATILSDEFHYDGTYNPNDNPAPAGNTTWQKYVGGTGVSLTWNDPSAGLATFSDTDSGRIAVKQVFTDSGFNADPSGYEWSYTMKLKFNAQSDSGVFFGMRNEGGSNGKAVWLSIQSSSGNLYWGNANANGYVTGTPIMPNNLIDSTLHTYTVTKYEADGTMFVQVLVDGVLKDTQEYATYFQNDTSSEGFGIFGNSSGTSDLIVDDVLLQYQEPFIPAEAILLDEFHYDGTYNPNDNPAPAGNTSWQKYVGGTGASLIWNSPSNSLASFLDTGSGRIAMKQIFSDGGFKADPSNYAWSYTMELQLNSQSGQGVFFGMRNEGNSNGKAVWLSIQSSSGNLYWGNAAANGYGSGTPIVTGNLIDGTLHSYTVTKYLDQGTGRMFVQMLLDGVLVDTQDYATYFQDDTSSEGFGIFGSSAGTSDLIVDDVLLQYQEPVDSPVSLISIIDIGAYTGTPNIVEIEINALIPSLSYLKGKSNLQDVSWDWVPHSNHPTNAFIATNLTYSLTSGTNKLIYIDVTGKSSEFFTVDVELE